MRTSPPLSPNVILLGDINMTITILKTLNWSSSNWVQFKRSNSGLNLVIWSHSWLFYVTSFCNIKDISLTVSDTGIANLPIINYVSSPDELLPDDNGGSRQNSDCLLYQMLPSRTSPRVGDCPNIVIPPDVLTGSVSEGYQGQYGMSLQPAGGSTAGLSPSRTSPQENWTNSQEHKQENVSFVILIRTPLQSNHHSQLPSFMIDLLTAFINIFTGVFQKQVFLKSPMTAYTLYSIQWHPPQPVWLISLLPSSLHLPQNFPFPATTCLFRCTPSSVPWFSSNLLKWNSDKQ